MYCACRVIKGGPGVHAVVNITDTMSVSAVHLRIEQISSFSGPGSQAWALDNFVVLGKRPQGISEDFDCVTSCNVLEWSSPSSVKVISNHLITGIWTCFVNCLFLAILLIIFKCIGVFWTSDIISWSLYDFSSTGYSPHRYCSRKLSR